MKKTILAAILASLFLISAVPVAFALSPDEVPIPSEWALADSDGDGTINLFDPDCDGDTIPNGIDNCMIVPNTDQSDDDGDDVGDVCDNCPYHANPDQDS